MTSPVPPPHPGLAGGPVYLDYNATTPVDPRVAEATWPHLTGHFGNLTHVRRLEDTVTTANEQTAKVLRAWEKNAATYDKQIAFFEKIWFGGGRQWLGTRAEGRVLEVAVGTGLNLPHYPTDARLTGIELSPAMLAIAERRAADLGRDIDVHTGDAEALPFDDDTFDTVVCALSLCTIPRPATAIAEMKRVLLPGGRLLLLDHIGSTWPPIHAAQWLLERITIRAAGEHFTRRQLPLVTAAGFEIVETERLKAGTIERIHARKPSADAVVPERARPRGLS